MLNMYCTKKNIEVYIEFVEIKMYLTEETKKKENDVDRNIKIFFVLFLSYYCFVLISQIDMYL